MTTATMPRHAAVSNAVARKAATLDLAKVGMSVLAFPLVCVGWLAWRGLTALRTGLRWSLAAFLVGVDLAKAQDRGAG